MTIGTDSENSGTNFSEFFGKSRFFAHFDPRTTLNAKLTILRVQYAVAARPLVEKVGGCGENLKSGKCTPDDAKKSICMDFYLRAASRSNPASKIAILAIFGLFHLRGYSVLFGKLGLGGRKLAPGWQSRLGMCSPDAQESNKWLSGHLSATCEGLPAQNQKLANRCNKQKNR